MGTHSQSSEDLSPFVCVCGGGGVVMQEAQVLMVEDSPHRTVQPAHNAILMRLWCSCSLMLLMALAACYLFSAQSPADLGGALVAYDSK